MFYGASGRLTGCSFSDSRAGRVRLRSVTSAAVPALTAHSTHRPPASSCRREAASRALAPSLSRRAPSRDAAPPRQAAQPRSPQPPPSLQAPLCRGRQSPIRASPTARWSVPSREGVRLLSPLLRPFLQAPLLFQTLARCGRVAVLVGVLTGFWCLPSRRRRRPLARPDGPCHQQLDVLRERSNRLCKGERVPHERGGVW